MSHVAKGMMFAAAFALFLGATQSVFADKSHEGKVVSVTEGSAGADGKLVMTDSSSKEHSHTISSSVKITLNDKTAKLGDLKKGDALKVTTDDKGTVKEVAAKR
ncbi:MAG: hypothetical protein ACT4QC_19560 [Planctomycetaceae bacterium]